MSKGPQTSVIRVKPYIRTDRVPRTLESQSSLEFLVGKIGGELRP